MKLLGSTESKITREKNGKHVPHLKITDKPFGSLLEISPTNCIFKKHSTQNMMELKYGSQIKIVNH